MLLRPLLIAGFSTFALLAQSQPGGTVIYKHVDDNGRVTYANVPIKGGVRVDLEPITVIPSTPSGSLGNPNAQPTPATNLIPVTPSPSAAATTPVAVAKVVPVGFKPAHEKISVKAPPVIEANDAPLPDFKNATLIVPMRLNPPAPADAPVAQARETPAPAQLAAALSPENINRVAEQRRQENRQRVLEGELEAEEQLLTQARTALTEEQRQSQAYRALRATLNATSEAGTPTLAKEKREDIERHFERVRNLQDQVAMHESQVRGLRDQIAAVK